MPLDLAVDSAVQTNLDAAVLQAAGRPVVTATVATQVDLQQLTPTRLAPTSPRSPRASQARPGRPRQRAETVEDVAVDLMNSQPEEDSDSEISNCLLQTWPAESTEGTSPGTKLQLPSLHRDADRADRSGAVRKKSALTVPTLEDVAGKDVLFTVSSAGHTAVMASYSDGARSARPSKRTINRPRLSSPGSPGGPGQYSTG